MKKQNFLLLIFSFCAFFTLLSCDPIPYKRGKATISITNNIEDSVIYSEKTSKNATTVFIYEYLVTATGPNGAKIEETVDAEEAFASFDSMRVGSYGVSW